MFISHSSWTFLGFITILYQYSYALAFFMYILCVYIINISILNIKYSMYT